MDVSIQTILTSTLERSVLPDSLVGRIAEWVASNIIEGHMQPGHDLNSVALARQFQTSRTPVREALLLLEKEGLVTIPPRRRPHVAQISLAEVHEIYVVRAHLYMLVSELIVEQASDEAIHSLRPYQARLEEAARAGERDTYFWGNLSFRATETEICGNVQVQRVLDSLGLRTLQLRHRSLAYPGRMEQSANDHARLLRAYEERDAPLAKAMTRSLVLGGLTAVEHSGWFGEQKEQNARAE